MSIWAASRVVESKGLDPREVFVFSLAPVEVGLFPVGVTVLTMDPRPSSLSEWRKPFALAEFTRRCLETLPTYGQIILYAPHVFEMPANVFAFHNERVVRREMLPDGLANYLPRPLVPEGFLKKLGFSARVSLRKIAARRRGLGYRMLFSGDMTQYERGIWSETYVFTDSHQVTVSGCTSKLKFGHSDRVDHLSGRGCLVIDQELREIANRALETRMRRKLVEVVGDVEPILYKPHPRGKDRIKEFGIDAQPAPLGLAERVALEAGVELVAGFYSTALLFLAEHSLRRIAILPQDGARGIVRPQFVRDLKAMLHATGAEIVEVL